MTPSGPTQKMKKRLKYAVLAGLLACFAVISGNLVNISVVQHSDYEKKANDYQLRREMIPASRGSIYDCNMQVLAQSASAWDVTINPAEIKTDADRLMVAKGLAQILDMDEKKILESTQKKTQYVLIKRRVEKDIADEVRQFIVEENKKVKAENEVLPEDQKRNSVTGMINLVENTKRYYPNGSLASSVIGFTGTDSQGLYGLELKYDEVLSGTPGYVVALKNALNENIPNDTEEGKFDPIDGSSLVLTIDETIQHFVEKTLQQIMVQNKPSKGCSAIVMNPKTGAILAMANAPDYDLNNTGEITSQMLLDSIEAAEGEEAKKKAHEEAIGLQRSNKCVSYAYEPGSTFKTVVASAALEEGTSNLNSSFFCPGFVQVADAKMGCHIGEPGHGTLDFTGAVINSCNPAFVAIGKSLGGQNYFKYFKNFGFAEKTGIDLPGEGQSHYYDGDFLSKSEVSLASCSFGQSLTITPIQLVTAFSAVVNGGYLYTPYVVQDVLDANGNVVKSVKPEPKRQVISEDTSAKMREILHQVVLQKPGSNAYVEGYDIGGKSGTAQKLVLNQDGIYISSYIAAAPIDDPQVVVMVMVDEATRGGYYGSVVASPPVTSILEDILPYLGISPKYTEEQLAKQNITVPKLLDMNELEATSKLAQVGLGKPEIVGEGDRVVRQVPGVGNQIPRDGKVILYMENVEEELVKVPDVHGLSPQKARAMLEALQLNVDIKGAGAEDSAAQVTAQSVEAETEVPIGTLITLTVVKTESD